MQRRLFGCRASHRAGRALAHRCRLPAGHGRVGRGPRNGVQGRRDGRAQARPAQLRRPLRQRSTATRLHRVKPGAGGNLRPAQLVRTAAETPKRSRRTTNAARISAQGSSGERRSNHRFLRRRVARSAVRAKTARRAGQLQQIVGRAPDSDPTQARTPIGRRARFPHRRRHPEGLLLTTGPRQGSDMTHDTYQLQQRSRVFNRPAARFTTDALDVRASALGRCRRALWYAATEQPVTNPTNAGVADSCWRRARRSNRSSSARCSAASGWSPRPTRRPRCGSRLWP